MSNINPLYSEGSFKVRTKFGSAKIVGRPLTKSGGIVFLTRPRKFGRGERGRDFPIGTPVVSHRELAKRTEGRVTHMIVADGLYRLGALATHIAAGSERDLHGMIVTRRDLEECAEFIRVSGQMPLDYHGKLKEFLAAIGDELDVPKRNEHKLAAAKRSKQAAVTQYRDERLKPGPGRIVTRAATIHAAKRVRELQEICPAVTYTMIRVHKLTTRIHGILDRIWHYFMDQQIEGLPLPIHTAMAKQSRTRPGVRATVIELEEFEAWLDELFIRPFTDLSRRLMAELRDLRKAIWSQRRDEVENRVRDVRKLVRRLRMARYIESQLLLRLYNNTAPLERDLILSRHAKLMDRVGSMSAAEMDEHLRRESEDYLELFREDVENGEIDDARGQLKQLAAVLATA